MSLAEAHRAGLVHRDIKPANMVVCRLGTQADFLKLLDFGLVTPTSLEAGDARMTTVGDITGTPAFMAPEQARGQVNLDGRCDIYALGCVAYWLLAGQLLFEGSPMEMVASHIKEEPRPLSIATLDPIPPALEALVMRCLAKEPDQRPASALDVLNALDALGLEEGWSEAHAQAWWQHHVGSRAPGNDPAESVALPSQ